MVTERTSFEQFVVGSADRLLRSAHLMTGDRGEAEDLVQECFLQITRRWRRVSEMDKPYSYALRVLTRLAVRSGGRRGRQRAELHQDMHERVAVTPALELVATRDELRNALLRLTRRQRTVLVLRYFLDLPDSEIAGMLGCSTGTVKSTISRSLGQLRAVIQPLPEPIRNEAP